MNELAFFRFNELSYAGQEAFNTLCTNIIFAGENKRKLMITSCHAGEGKSFISMNIMRCMAKLGYRVVLVDADLRRSQIKSKYGMRIVQGEGKGLSHYLAGLAKMDEVLYSTNIPNAYHIPVGYEVKNSLGLLQNSNMNVLMHQLGKQFDLVIVDAPPLGLIIDAATIATHCDGSIIAIKYNSVSYKELEELKAQLERSGCSIIGTVLNDVSFDSLSSKKYYNKYSYSYYESDYYKPQKDRVKNTTKHTILDRFFKRRNHAKRR